MKNFLLDIWHDLRAKRLWPVALVLLTGLVAVPVVLSKKSEEPTVAQPATTKAGAPEASGPAELTQVKLEKLGQGAGSSLSSFNDPANPFAPPPEVIDSLGGPEVSEAGASLSGASPGGGDVTVDGGSSGGDAATGTTTGTGDTGTNNTGAGDTGGGSPGAGETGGGGTGGGNTGGGGTTTVAYTYVVDVTFRANNRVRKIKAMEKLEMLPSRAAPLFIFLGVTPNAGNALFLVDATLDAAGEGSCKPSRTECAFLYLGPGSEHEFTNAEGDSYTLRVDEIRRVKLDADKTAGASRREGRKIAGAAVEQPTPVRRFVLPLLADVLSVSSGR